MHDQKKKKDTRPYLTLQKKVYDETKKIIELLAAVSIADCSQSPSKMTDVQKAKQTQEHRGKEERAVEGYQPIREGRKQMEEQN